MSLGLSFVNFHNVVNLNQDQQGCMHFHHHQKSAVDYALKTQWCHAVLMHDQNIF